MRVKRSELPRILGVSRQQVHADIKEGFYGPGDDGLFDLAEVLRGRSARDPFRGGPHKAPATPHPVLPGGRRRTFDPDALAVAAFRSLVEAVGRYLDARFRDPPAPWGTEFRELREAAAEAIALFPAGPEPLRRPLYTLAGLVQTIGDTTDRMLEWLEVYEDNGGGPAAMVFPAELGHFLDLVLCAWRGFFERVLKGAEAGRLPEVPLGNGKWMTLPFAPEDLDEVLDLFRLALAAMEDAEMDGDTRPPGPDRKPDRPPAPLLPPCYPETPEVQS